MFNAYRLYERNRPQELRSMMELENQDAPEPVASRIFHIHIDATEMPRVFDRYAREELGCVLTDFSGHPEGYQHFEPQAHYTFKSKHRDRFRQVWKDLCQHAEGSGFVGYLEGEYIRSDVRIEARPYGPNVSVPFQIERRKLRGAEAGEMFREAELHFTLDKDASHPDLIHTLLEAGLYGAYLPKQNHVGLVLTMQGHEQDVHAVASSLLDFLKRAGGATRGTLKEERAISHRLFGITYEDLPEIADRVIFMP